MVADAYVSSLATSGESRLNYARCAKLSPKLMLAQPIEAYPGNEVCPTGGGGTSTQR